MSKWSRFWKAFAEHGKYAFKGTANYLKKIMPELFKMLPSGIKDQMLQFAINVCSKIDKETLTNSEKRDKAFGEIKDELIDKGFAVRKHVINLLIELAVNYIRSMTEKLGDHE